MIARVPAWALGLMRATRAVTGAGNAVDLRTSALRPIVSPATSSGASAASSSICDRSTISTRRVSIATRSPVCAMRCDTSPEIGATRVASLRLLRASATADSAAS